MQYRSIQHGFFLVLLALTTLAFLGVIQHFLLPLFWSVVLATLFYPMYERILSALGGRASIAAGIALVAIIIVVLVPLALVGLAVTEEITAFYNRVTAGEIDVQAMIARVEEALPVVDDYLNRFGVEIEDIRENLSTAAVATSRFLASEALTIGQSAVTFTIQLFLMLYVLFFFLRDGRFILDKLIYALPLGDDRERKLFSKFAEVSRATIKGTLVVGIVQGSLGGLMFWILGIPGPVFWGVVMTLLSLLPAVGSAIVWGPAALILLFNGDIFKGIALIAAGTLIIGLVDNVLRPVLVSRDTQIPDFLVLIATLGGLTIFGISGFVIGPIIAAFFLVVWDMFAEEYAREDDPPMVQGEPKHPEAPPEDGAPPETPRPVEEEHEEPARAR